MANKDSSSLTSEQIQEKLFILENIPSLNLNQALEGYRLSLAIADFKKANDFTLCYKHALSDFFYDISMHITNNAYYKKFLMLEEAWRELFTYQSKICFIAIMIKNNLKSNETMTKKIMSYVSRENFFLKENRILESNKSIAELKSLIDEEVLAEHKRSIIRDLLYQAENSDDIDLVLDLYKKNILSEDKQNHLLFHIAYLKSKQNYEAAIGMVSDLDPTRWDYKLEELKYNAAKYLVTQNFSKAISIIEELNESKYIYGFRALSYSFFREEQQIIDLIEQVDKLLKINTLDDFAYDSIILEMAFSIVDTYPLIVLDLIEKLHQNWGYILDLQSRIAIAFSKINMQAGLDYIDDIEVDIFKVFALKGIIKKGKNQKNIDSVINKIVSIQDVTCQYELFVYLQHKLSINQEKSIYNLAMQLLPYDNFSLVSILND